MKKIAILFMFFFIAGCGHLANESEFWQHKTIYASWDHMKFSISGHNRANAEDFKKSQKEGWWGIPVAAKDSKCKDQ